MLDNLNHLNDDTLDNLMEGFQLIGFDWKYLYVNSAVVKQSKYSSKQDLLGFTMMEKYPGIENTEMFRALRSCMKERAPVNFENEFKFPDGSTGWFELRIQPVPEGLFILSTDISERKKGELAKLEHVKKLEEMMYMTSHRLRQPVAHIMGISNILDKSICSKEELKKILDYIKESALSIDKFTRELTDFIHTEQTRTKEV